LKNLVQQIAVLPICCTQSTNNLLLTIPTFHCVIFDAMNRLHVGVPLLGGVDGFHQRVGCVKPDVI